MEEPESLPGQLKFNWFSDDESSSKKSGAKRGKKKRAKSAAKKSALKKKPENTSPKPKKKAQKTKPRKKAASVSAQENAEQPKTQLKTAAASTKAATPKPTKTKTTKPKSKSTAAKKTKKTSTAGKKAAASKTVAVKQNAPVTNEPAVDSQPHPTQQPTAKALTTPEAPAGPTRPLRKSYDESVEALELKWGARLPQVGFGFWKVEQEKTADVCRTAIELGYRHLDCACDYGNEVEVGQGIAEAINDGVCDREDLWVTSKLWNTYHAAEHVKQACERSLQDLGLDYLDLYLIHFPIAQRFVPFEKSYPPGWFFDADAANPVVEEARVSIKETWQAMEELATSGLVRNIGISNFGTSQIRDLLSYAYIRPSVLQVETHPYLTQEKLLRYCNQEKIAYTAFSPLGAQSYFSLGMADPAESVMQNNAVTEIAKATGKTAAQVLLRWGIQRGTAVIPKSSDPGRMEQNIDVFDFELSGTQMAAITALNQGRRFNDPGDFGEAAFNTFLPIYE